MYEYNAIVKNVVDGDTFDLDIDLGFHIHIHERVRLLNVDTPEKFGDEKPLGLKMKEYATKYFLNQHIIIRSEKSAQAADTDSFGRWLVETTLDNGYSISEIYSNLGVNKLSNNYNPQNVLNLIL